MAFPGTYNINYYKGDTLEFKVYPKKADGSVFDLTGYTVKFAFSTSRGSAGSSDYHEALATISNDSTNVLCVIRPGDSSHLNAGTTYYYDVEVTKTGTPYDIVHTIVTGTITVTDQVSVG